MVIENRIIKLLLIISTIMVVDLIYYEIARSETDTKININRNLKPGMPLKDAIDLLGPPERIQVSQNGTILLPYKTLGLSIETMSDGTLIEGIHINSNFSGQFASGIKIGVDYQKILSTYNQPDIMTKDMIEYYDKACIFLLQKGKLVGADLYSEKSILYRQVSSKETGSREEVHKISTKETGKHEEDREVSSKETEEDEEIQVLDIFGIKVKSTFEGIVITEIRPDSVSEYGGLQVGERIRKASLKGYGVRNIYTISGLKSILKKAIDRNKKTVNILQDKNYYYVVEVPKIK